jgi:uncharacterized peroxidase-related enzyme
MELNVHDLQSAPAQSKDILEKGQSTYGFIPNLWAVMAESPALLKAYTTAYEIYQNETILDSKEQHLIALTISTTNDCGYCKAAHSMIGRMVGLDENTLDKIKNNQSLDDSKLESLRTFTKIVLEKSGLPSEGDINTFINAGYTKQHVLEVILGIGVKIISNYTNHLANTPIDEAFLKQPTN